MLSLTYIYALLAPDSDEIRYIGKSSNPQRRLTAHLRDSKREKHRHASWIKSLTIAGQSPRIEIIAEVPVSEWQSWEQHYIKYFREVGFILTNLTPGGDGVGEGAGHPNYGTTNPQHSKAMSGPGNPMWGKTQSASTRALIGAVHRGKLRTPEHRAKLGAALKGRIFSLETRAKISAAKRGQKYRSRTHAV